MVVIIITAEVFSCSSSDCICFPMRSLQLRAVPGLVLCRAVPGPVLCRVVLLGLRGSLIWTELYVGLCV